jgi:hypothetical protein
MQNFHDLLKTANELCAADSKQTLPFGLIIISNPRNADDLTYISVEAGSKKHFIGTKKYKRLATVTFAYDNKTDLYFLNYLSAYKKWNKIVDNDITVPRNFIKIINDFIEALRNKKAYHYN